MINTKYKDKKIKSLYHQIKVKNMKLEPRDRETPSCRDNLVIESFYDPAAAPTTSIREVRRLCAGNQSESSMEESFFVPANQVNITLCSSANQKSANFQLRWQVVEDEGYYDVTEDDDRLGEVESELQFKTIQENSGDQVENIKFEFILILIS